MESYTIFLTPAVPAIILLFFAATVKTRWWIFWFVLACIPTFFAVKMGYEQESDYGMYILFLLLVVTGFRSVALGYLLSVLLLGFWIFGLGFAGQVPSGHYVIILFSIWAISVVDIIPDDRKRLRKRPTEDKDIRREHMNVNVQKELAKCVKYFFMGLAVFFLVNAFWSIRMFDGTVYTLVYFMVFTAIIAVAMACNRPFFYWAWVVLAIAVFVAYSYFFALYWPEQVLIWSIFAIFACIAIRNYGKTFKAVQLQKASEWEFEQTFGSFEKISKDLSKAERKEELDRQKRWRKAWMENEDIRVGVRTAKATGRPFVSADFSCTFS